MGVAPMGLSASTAQGVLFQVGQFFAMVQDELAQALQDPAAFGRRHAAPGAFHRPPRRRDRQVHVRRPAARDPVDRRLRGLARCNGRPVDPLLYLPKR